MKKVFLETVYFQDFPTQNKYIIMAKFCVDGKMTIYDVRIVAPGRDPCIERRYDFRDFERASCCYAEWVMEMEQNRCCDEIRTEEIHTFPLQNKVMILKKNYTKDSGIIIRRTGKDPNCGKIEHEQEFDDFKYAFIIYRNACNDIEDHEEKLRKGGSMLFAKDDINKREKLEKEILDTIKELENFISQNTTKDDSFTIGDITYRTSSGGRVVIGVKGLSYELSLEELTVGKHIDIIEKILDDIEEIQTTVEDYNKDLIKRMKKIICKVK